jgi:hypothetical protein
MPLKLTYKPYKNELCRIKSWSLLSGGRLTSSAVFYKGKLKADREHIDISQTKDPDFRV